jgi:hypothetical protein
MAYYNSDFENVAGDSWYEPSASLYPSWAPGTEYAAANAAAFISGGGFIGATTDHEAFRRLAEE